MFLFEVENMDEKVVLKAYIGPEDDDTIYCCNYSR